jgi:hypothetical protein
MHFIKRYNKRGTAWIQEKEKSANTAILASMNYIESIGHWTGGELGTKLCL